MRFHPVYRTFASMTRLLSEWRIFSHHHPYFFVFFCLKLFYLYSFY